MRGAEDEHEAGVNDDLTKIVGTRDQVEKRPIWDWVSVWTLDFELGKYFVRLKLQIPGEQEHEGEEPAVEGQGGGEARLGGAGEARGLADEASGGAEVVSVADNIVSDVHGRVARLVDDQALVEAPEHLEGEQRQHQHQAGGGGGLLSVRSAHEV